MEDAAMLLAASLWWLSQANLYLACKLPQCTLSTPIIMEVSSSLIDKDLRLLCADASA